MTHVPAGAGRYPALNICMTMAAYSSSSLVHFPLLRGVTLAAGAAVEVVLLLLLSSPLLGLFGMLAARSLEDEATPPGFGLLVMAIEGEGGVSSFCCWPEVEVEVATSSADDLVGLLAEL